MHISFSWCIIFNIRSHTKKNKFLSTDGRGGSRGTSNNCAGGQKQLSSEKEILLSYIGVRRTLNPPQDGKHASLSDF